MYILKLKLHVCVIANIKTYMLGGMSKSHLLKIQKAKDLTIQFPR